MIRRAGTGRGQSSRRNSESVPPSTKMTLPQRKSAASESMKRMLGIEKFSFYLHQLLKKKGLLPEGEAEFVLKMNESSIDGKKLSKEIHRKIIDLCEESLGKKFVRGTKVILHLNEDR